MKKLYLAISIFVIAVFLIAANNIDIQPSVKRTITIEDIDSDWVWTDSFPQFPKGIRIYSIRFHPGATDDLCSIEDYDNGEVKHFLSKCADTYDDRLEYKPHDVRYKLRLDYQDTDGTWTAAYTAGASLTITLWGNQ